MARGQSAYLMKRGAAMMARAYARYQQQLDVCLQIGADAAVIAANRKLGLGRGRARQFMDEYKKAANDIAAMIDADGAEDKELVYSRAKIDEQLRQIVGDENFSPWEERYNEMEGKSDVYRPCKSSCTLHERQRGMY